MNEVEIMHILGELESSTRSAHKRIDEIKELVESINKLTIAIKGQQNSIDNMAKRLEKIEDKPALPPCQHVKDFERFESKISNLSKEINEIKDKPVKRWEKFVSAIISSLAGGIMGYILAVILK